MACFRALEGKSEVLSTAIYLRIFCSAEILEVFLLLFGFDFGGEWLARALRVAGNTLANAVPHLLLFDAVQRIIIKTAKLFAQIRAFANSMSGYLAP